MFWYNNSLLWRYSSKKLFTFQVSSSKVYPPPPLLFTVIEYWCSLVSHSLTACCESMDCGDCDIPSSIMAHGITSQQHTTKIITHHKNHNTSQNYIVTHHNMPIYYLSFFVSRYRQIMIDYNNNNNIQHLYSAL